jgi:dienelactone hydrolase
MRGRGPVRAGKFAARFWATAACLSACAAGATNHGSLAVNEVDVPSLERVGSAPLSLPGYWFPAQGAASAPAMLLLHGCGGALAPGTQDLAGRRHAPLSRRMIDYAGWLGAHGVHVLVIDSLTPRGERELCTQRLGQRRVTQAQRRRDALGALQWMATRPEVDVRRIGLLGWSHGGSAVLAATDANHREVAASPVSPALAVAFYPGCTDAQEHHWRPSVPLMMLVGEADDWTPAGPCRALAARTTEPATRLVSYPGAYHGFDSERRVRLRTDVPNGVNPGQGVHVGGDPAARADSREQVLRFMRERFGAR